MVVTSVNDSTTGRDESENIITPSMNNHKDNANEIDLQLKEVSSGSPSVDNTPVEWSSFRGVKDGASNAPSSNSASLPIVQTPMMQSASSLSASSKVSHKESSIDTDDIDSSNGNTSNTNRNELNTIVSSSMPSFATTTATSSEAKSTEGLLNAQSSSDERSGGSNQKDELSVSSNQPNAVSLATTATAISITTTAVTPVHPPRRQLFPPNTAPETSTNANARNTYLKQPNTISDSNNNNNTGNSNNQNKTAFDAFGDFLTVFFRKAEVYEEELERRQSQRELLLKREDSGDEGDAVNTSFKKNLSSPRLSPTMEAMAAVEAMSSFRSLKEVKIELKESQSFDQEGGQQNKKKRKTSESNLQDVATEEKLQPLLSENAKLVDNLIPAEDESMKNEWAEQWKQFCEEKKKNKFKEVAIQNMTLPLTVNEFYQLVLRDDASDSIGNFMRDIGDLIIDTTPWQPQHDSKKSGTPSTRTIHYVHPVNAPMAPPTAKAQKTQYLHKFGSVGLCLETCTIVEDVPMTDCFVVDDRLWVSESIDGDGCNVEVTFNIRFVKSTMFRRIIENATRSEFNKFWGQFGSMIELLESPSAEKELGVKKEELEEVITMVEDELTEEGQEMPLSKVIGLIRESSRRRSIMTKSPSSKRVVHRAEEASTSPAANVVSLITKYMSENSQLVGLVFAFMLLLNFLAIWQMIRMNQFLSVLDDHLQKMSRANDALLSKLAADHVCK